MHPDSCGEAIGFNLIVAHRSWNSEDFFLPRHINACDFHAIDSYWHIRIQYAQQLGIHIQHLSQKMS